MPEYPFDARIVLGRKDLRSKAGPISLEAVMDAVSQALARIPGIAAIDVCYLGTRAPKVGRVHIRPHDTAVPAVSGHWNAFLLREVERHANEALAGLSRKAAA
jgi:hypothetical protein